MATKLSDLDFMMMDVHRPLTEEEIDEVNPQARVDKSIEHKPDEAESMGEPPPRCGICFVPMPCAQHANVAEADIATTHDLPVERILARAYDRGLEHVVVVGVGRDGQEYFASSVADAAEAMYHLTRGLYKLNRQIDKLTEGEDEP